MREKIRRILDWDWFKKYSLKRRVWVLLGIVLIGISIDVLLSYLAYLRDPSHFIQYEQSWEAIAWARDGVFPVFSVVMIIGLPLSLYWTLQSVQKMNAEVDTHASHTNEKRLKNIRYMLRSFESTAYEVCVVVCFMRIIGGLSWWSDARIISVFFGLGIGYLAASMVIMGVFIVVSSYLIRKIKKKASVASLGISRE